MGDGVRLPSTFNYGQTIEWIANAIGQFMSSDCLFRELWHLNSNYPGAEPPLNLIIRRLNDAMIDEGSINDGPRMSVQDAIRLARDSLDDALRGGRVEMSGRATWEIFPEVKQISKLQCNQLRFSENKNNVAIAVVVSNPAFFWDTIRFDSTEIMREWPLPNRSAQSVKGSVAVQAPNRASVGRPKGTTKEAEDMPFIIAAEKLLSDKAVNSVAEAIRRVASSSSESDQKRISRWIKIREREKKGR